MIKKEEEEQKTLDGKKAGLSRSAKERREESQLLRQKEREVSTQIVPLHCRGSSTSSQIQALRLI